MQLTGILDEDSAVSPVIGVILMVAITVILAAVLGTFVFGLSGQVQSSDAPTASMSEDFDSGAASIDSSADAACSDGSGNSIGSGDGELAITLESGESIDVDRLTIRGSSAVGSKDWATCSGLSSGDEVTAGDAAYIEVSESDTVRVVWQSADGETSDTVTKWDGAGA